MLPIQMLKVEARSTCEDELRVEIGGVPLISVSFGRGWWVFWDLLWDFLPSKEVKRCSLLGGGILAQSRVTSHNGCV